jgi:hypothetical protein
VSFADAQPITNSRLVGLGDWIKWSCGLAGAKRSPALVVNEADSESG